MYSFRWHTCPSSTSIIDAYATMVGRDRADLPLRDARRHRGGACADRDRVPRARVGEGMGERGGILTGPRTSSEEVAELIAEPDAGSCSPRTMADSWVACSSRSTATTATSACSRSTLGADRGPRQGLARRAEQSVRYRWGTKGMTAVVINVRENLLAWYERRGYVHHRRPSRSRSTSTPARCAPTSTSSSCASRF